MTLAIYFSVLEGNGIGTLISGGNAGEGPERTPGAGGRRADGAATRRRPGESWDLIAFFDDRDATGLPDEDRAPPA